MGLAPIAGMDGRPYLIPRSKQFTSAMKTYMSPPLPEDFSPSTKTAFNVLVAYDDAAMGLRAKHLLESVARTLEPDCELVLGLWKFSMLQLPALADGAADDAAAANLIILALREDNGVPRAVKDWIESWLTRRVGAEGALVLLLDPARDTATAVTPTHFYLHDVGRRGNLEVFALKDEADWDTLNWLYRDGERPMASGLPHHPLLGHHSDRTCAATPQDRIPLCVRVCTPDTIRPLQVA